VKINEIIAEAFQVTKNGTPILGQGAGKTWKNFAKSALMGANFTHRKNQNPEDDALIHQALTTLSLPEPGNNANAQTVGPTPPPPKEGTVQLVQAANGEQYFKAYSGTWHKKGATPADFSVGGTKITKPAEIEALDKLLPTAKLVGVKPDPKYPTGDAWVYDQRKTALLAKRGGKI
jgi:hypothetical protein